MAADRDLVADLERWEDLGAVWRVVHRSPGSVTIALLRCDGGEEVDRLTTTDPHTLAFVGRRDGGP
jgi:hypothetical protein